VSLEKKKRKSGPRTQKHKRVQETSKMIDGELGRFVVKAARRGGEYAGGRARNMSHNYLPLMMSGKKAFIQEFDARTEYRGERGEWKRR